MSTRATATFQIKNWDEKAYDEQAGRPKLTRARVTQAYQGDLEGNGTIEYLMAYGDDGSASYVGVERVVGSIGGRAGSFVLQHAGRFEGGVAKSSVTVVPGSGTDALRGLRGTGGFEAGHEDRYPVTLDYDFG